MNEDNEAPDRSYLLTIEEVAEALKVHHQTVRTYIAERKLGCVNLGSEKRYGRRIRVSAEQLAAFIDAHTVDAEAS